MNWRLLSFAFLCLADLSTVYGQAPAESLDYTIQTLSDEVEIFKREVSSLLWKSNSQIQILTKKVEELQNRISNCEDMRTPRPEENNTAEIVNVTVEHCKGLINASCPWLSVIIPIRPGQLKNVSVTFNLRHHPVDIYYLMYATTWNRDEIRSLINLSDDLRQALANMSDDHTLGFGTFTDKPGRLYKNKGYYSYHNSYPLSPDTSNFGSALAARKLAVRVSPNHDSRADAIYQAVICNKDVGWRPNARHVLVVLPGQDFMVAGNGKNFSPPITKRFDEQCHLNSRGYYSEELRMDYPSEEQVRDVIERSKTNVIFHVWSRASSKNTDEGLAAKAKASAWSYLTAEPAGSDLVRLLVQDYKKIARKVELEHTNAADIVLSFFSDCNNGAWRETNICDDIGEKGEVTFVLQLSFKRCPVDPVKRFQNVTVNPVGLPTSVNISVELLCGD